MACPRAAGAAPAEVVQLALTRGTAVIHIPPEPDARTRVLWAAFDPTVVTVMDEPTVERSLDGDDVDIMLRGLLLPPPDPQEKHFLDRFFKRAAEPVPGAARIFIAADGRRVFAVSRRATST